MDISFGGHFSTHCNVIPVLVLKELQGKYVLTGILKPGDSFGRRVLTVFTSTLFQGLSCALTQVLFLLVLCCCSVASSRPTLCSPMDCSTPGFPVLHCLPELLKLMSIELVMPSNHLILCHPLALLLSVFPSIRVFSSELALHIRWPNIGASASASFLPMNIWGWFPLGLTGLISSLSKGLSSYLTFLCLSF